MVGVPELAQALVVRLGPAALAGDTRIVAPVIARRGLAGTAVGHRRRHGMAVHDMEGLIGGCFPPDTEAGLRRMSPGASLAVGQRSEEHTSELQSLMRNSSAVFRLKKKKHEQPHDQ